MGAAEVAARTAAASSRSPRKEGGIGAAGDAGGAQDGGDGVGEGGELGTNSMCPCSINDSCHAEAGIDGSTPEGASVAAA